MPAKAAPHECKLLMKNLDAEGDSSERHDRKMKLRCQHFSALALWVASLGVLVPIIASADNNPSQSAAIANAGTDAASPRPINVLILGDSLSLCGFGKRLDERLRKDPRVKTTFTYMTCGTTPLSWLKQKPYTNVKTHCGFWSIESVPGAAHPHEMQDTYGMRRKYSPKPHTVPKVEDLLETVQPDILIMQTGTNLFDLFAGRKTIRPEHDGTALRNYLIPFVARAIKAPSPLRKIYWVASPTSGRVAEDVQQFVFEQTRADLQIAATVIDSRALVSYPYHHMEPDREHFLGADMDQWADGVFDIVERDMSSSSIASLKPLSETVQLAGAASEHQPARAEPDSETLLVKAKLVFKSQPIQLRQLLPYQELLVAYVYDVKKVVSGEYSEKQILVMHPAYIGLQPQRLGKYRIGKNYKLRLQQLEGTPWETAKARDDSGLIDLQPYIRIEDERKYPGNAR